ncbi:MAG: PDC sensor domain-containing protein [Sulfurovum sp.]|nr:PDC sensor domain-containing protein [Sulfurovum sp.]
MKELISIFQKNRTDILKHLMDTIEINEIKNIKNENLNEAFFYLAALETVYAVDENYTQLSPIFNRNQKNGAYLDEVKKRLKENTHLNKEGYFISAPYVSEKTNKLVVTLVRKIDDRLIAFDFDLYKLMKELRHTGFKEKIFLFGSKSIYAFIGLSLTLFAILLVAYSLYDFSNNIFNNDTNIFQLIFRSAIGLTLGLAIFDLAKNLLEHEVVFKDEYNEAHGGNRLLVKFMISIVIALAIESLMMVFKIAISNYKEMIHAAILILSIGFLLIAMSQFNKYLNNK